MDGCFLCLLTGSSKDVFGYHQKTQGELDQVLTGLSLFQGFIQDIWLAGGNIGFGQCISVTHYSLLSRCSSLQSDLN